MSDKRIWIGPRGSERWLLAPNRGADFAEHGYENTMEYLNGGLGVRTSKAGHFEYNMAWAPAARRELYKYIQMFEGVYDTQDGINLIYWTDPFAAPVNCAPQNWGFPAIASDFGSGMPLVFGVRPTLVPGDTGNYDYPARSAVYKPGGDSVPTYIPIPPGYAAWVGWHGEAAAGSGVTVTPQIGMSPQATTLLTPIGQNSPVRVNTRFGRGDGYTGIELSLLRNTVVTLNAVIVVVIPEAEVPYQGEYASGQGNSGCQFEQRPSLTAYSAPRDLVGLTAKLSETGAWL